MRAGTSISPLLAIACTIFASSDAARNCSAPRLLNPPSWPIHTAPLQPNTALKPAWVQVQRTDSQTAAATVKRSLDLPRETMMNTHSPPWPTCFAPMEDMLACWSHQGCRHFHQHARWQLAGHRVSHVQLYVAVSSNCLHLGLRCHEETNPCVGSRENNMQCMLGLNMQRQTLPKCVCGGHATMGLITVIKSPSARTEREDCAPSAALCIAPPAVDSGSAASVLDRMSTSHRVGSTYAAPVLAKHQLKVAVQTVATASPVTNASWQRDLPAES